MDLSLSLSPSGLGFSFASPATGVVFIFSLSRSSPTVEYTKSFSSQRSMEINDSYSFSLLETKVKQMLNNLKRVSPLFESIFFLFL